MGRTRLPCHRCLKDFRIKCATLSSRRLCDGPSLSKDRRPCVINPWHSIPYPLLLIFVVVMTSNSCSGFVKDFPFILGSFFTILFIIKLTLIDLFLLHRSGDFASPLIFVAYIWRTCRYPGRSIANPRTLAPQKEDILVTKLSLESLVWNGWPDYLHRSRQSRLYSWAPDIS